MKGGVYMEARERGEVRESSCSIGNHAIFFLKNIYKMIFIKKMILIQLLSSK